MKRKRLVLVHTEVPTELEGRGLGGTWVVAVSGGGDSVGLLRVLHQLAPAVGLRL